MQLRKNAFLELLVEFWVSDGDRFSTEGPPGHILGVPLVLPQSEAAGVGRTAGRLGWAGLSQVVKRHKRTGQ